MLNALATAFQIFGIGFSFGIIGPCFLSCSPILIAYVTATKRNLFAAFVDVLVFLSARLSAYLILGFLAGLSGLFLRRFIDSNVSLFFRPASGIISIILGISILIGKKINHFTYEFAANKITNFSSIFILGFIVGILPCAPLIALLFEIVLISHSPLMGMFYAFSFGLGTFLSGLIVLGSLAGIFTWIPAKILKSKISNFIFKIICAFLLILLGISIIFRGFFS